MACSVYLYQCAFTITCTNKIPCDTASVELGLHSVSIYILRRPKHLHLWTDF